MPAAVHTTTDAFGTWTRATRAPRTDIGQLLSRPLVGFEQHSATFTTWLEAPTPELTLMINLEGGLRVDGTALPDAWIAGVDDRPVRVGFAAPYRTVELKLTPTGAYALLRRPLRELSQELVVSLADVFGRRGDELAQRLRDAPDWDARFDVVEAFIAARVADGPAPAPVVTRALDTLRASGGSIRIGALATDLRCSRRHLSALFATQVGVAPKTVARLLRFEVLCRRLDADAARWAEIAAECGFADQPHLNREVRELAGISPTELIARRMPNGGLVGDDLPFVQDGVNAAA